MSHVAKSQMENNAIDAQSFAHSRNLTHLRFPRVRRGAPPHQQHLPSRRPLVSALALLQPAYAPAHFIGANTVVNTETAKSLRIAIKPTQALQSVALATRGSELPTVRIAVKPSPLLVSLANALRGVGQPATKVGAAAVARAAS